MMKCKVVQNEGFIYIFLLIFISIVNCSFTGQVSSTIQELCSSNRYIYSVQPGESYQLKLTSVNVKGEIDKWYQKSKRKCLKEFKTNNGDSHFNIVISNMSVPTCNYDNCHCNYFEIAEFGNRKRFCGENKDEIYFESKSDCLSIDFYHGSSMVFEVTLTFTVLRNTYMITGLPKDHHQSGHFLESPYFPKSYQSDYMSEYILQSDDLNGHVMLMFLDFQIAPGSFIEVVGHNGTHPAKFYGDIFRPPVVVSQKHQLSLKFEANNQPGFGFRAVCFFLKNSDVVANIPFTNCGGKKEGYGGTVSIENHSKHNYYDCLWHVSPHMFIVTQSYFLSVSNISLENIGPKASIEFREGLNSKSKLVKSIDCDSLNCSRLPAEIIVPASSGLYIRFNGLLNADSVIRMIYSTYHNGNCSEKEVNCNERCLLSDLRCDGIEHCPDGRDEQECFVKTAIQTTTSHPTPTKTRLHSENTFASFIVLMAFGIIGLLCIGVVVVFAAYHRFKIVPLTPEPNVQPEVVISEMTGPPTNVRTSTFGQLPSYDDFIISSDHYPPLLYTRAAKRHPAIFADSYNIQHTTSFCGKDEKTHQPSPSVHHRGLSSVILERDLSNESVLFPEPGCSFSRNNAEWTFDDSELKHTSHSLKRAASYDSRLHLASENACQLHLSITHSICHHSCCTERYNSLPAYFKVKDIKLGGIDITFQTIMPETGCHKKRRVSSCGDCHNSFGVRSEIMTKIKGRCNSDPCRKFVTHCILRTNP